MSKQLPARGDNKPPQTATDYQPIAGMSVANDRLSEDLTQAAASSGRRPLRIAMVIDAYVPARNGTVESTRRFAEGLRARGHQVTIMSTGHAETDKIVVPEIRIPYATPHIIKPMQMALGRPGQQFKRLRALNLDIIHVQLPFYLGYRATRFAASEQIACVATHHVQAEWCSNAGITWRPFIKLVYKLFLQTYRRAACLICPSQMGLDDLAAYGFKGESEVISNGVPEIFQPPVASEEQQREENTYFTILSVGRLAVEKFHDITIRGVAASRFAGKIKLVIAGGGPQKEKLQHLAKSLPNAVEFILVKPEKLVEYYHQADLFVHSAETEMEGMACLEAIACGCVPLIADGPLSASTQFVLDERSTYPLQNITALAAKIDYWVEHRDELKLMRPRYAKHAQQYRFETSLDKLENLYYAVAQQPTSTITETEQQASVVQDQGGTEHVPG